MNEPKVNSQTSWAETEFSSIDFSDQRLNKRLIRLADDLQKRPSACINMACDDWAATKAAYRFFDNDKVTAEKILSPHQSTTKQRIAEQDLILAVQDTTYVDFSHHPKTKGVGPIGTQTQNISGFVKHTTMAFTENGLPLGILTDSLWARDPQTVGAAKARKQRPIEEKESYKWIAALKETVELTPLQSRVISICDREADIYEFFVEAEKLSTEFVVRATQDRAITDESRRIREKVSRQPVAGRFSIEVTCRKTQQSRTAWVEVRFAKVTLRPPKRTKAQCEEKLKEVLAYVVWVSEVNPPNPKEAIDWLLVTNVRVFDFDSAFEKVQWYSQRWQIEVYFKVLKSGCQIETPRLAEKARLLPFLRLKSIVAWRLFWLSQINRFQPDVSCTTILANHEWKALYAIIHKTKDLPNKPPTVNQVVRWIGQLGGFLGRKSDGHPGVVVIWRGWQRLGDLAEIWRLSHPEELVGNS